MQYAYHNCVEYAGIGSCPFHLCVTCELGPTVPFYFSSKQQQQFPPHMYCIKGHYVDWIKGLTKFPFLLARWLYKQHWCSRSGFSLGSKSSWGAWFKKTLSVQIRVLLNLKKDPNPLFIAAPFVINQENLFRQLGFFHSGNGKLLRWSETPKYFILFMRRKQCYLPLKNIFTSIFSVCQEAHLPQFHPLVYMP